MRRTLADSTALLALTATVLVLPVYAEPTPEPEPVEVTSEEMALGVVTSIDPEILLLDEEIGAVDAVFLERAKGRLADLVDRAGLLVFASHSEEFLHQLCDTALWLEHGRIRAQGDLDDVLRQYSGTTP